MLFPTLKKFNASRMHIFWILAAITMPLSAGQQFVGDSCKMKSKSGICKLASECPELEMAVRTGAISPRDIVTCGFATHEEIICCPSAATGEVTTDNRSDDRLIFEQSTPSSTFPTTTSSSTTSTTTTKSSSTDFWSHLLTTTPKPLADTNKEDTTTTPKPFWAHLLTTTPKPLADPQEVTTSTTPKQDFWLYLLNSTTTTTTTTTTPPPPPIPTTTTTTTVKPLIINGQEVDPNARFIDLTAMLSDNSRESDRPSERFSESRSESDHENENGGESAQFFDQSDNIETNRNLPLRTPHSINDRGMGWRSSPMHMLDRNVNWNAPRTRQFPHNGMPNAFHDGPRNNNFETFRPAGPMNMGGMAFIQQPRPIPMDMSQHIPNRGPNPNVVSNPIRFPEDVAMGGPMERPRSDRTFGNKWNFPQPMRGGINHNNNPDFNVPQQLEWHENNDFSHANPHSENIWPSNAPPPRVPINPLFNQPLRALRSTTRHPNSVRSTRNPIDVVNGNLRKAGFQVISAEENGISGSSKRPTYEILDERPVWGSAKSGNGRPTKTTTPATPTVTPRSTDRPAVAACRKIDAGLSGSLSFHIIGGTPADPGEFPHMAAIGYSSIGNDQGPYDYRCGGTLIDARFVLTAAHCVNSRDSQPAVVLLGLININDPEQRRDAEEIPIREIHIHPDYSNGRVYHDIAILELERAAAYSDLIYPTCLHTDLNDPPAKTELYVTGWGQINTTTRMKSTLLLKAKLDVVDVNQCNASYVQMGLNRRIIEGITEEQMCAHDPGYTRDACQGDSGGPLNMVVDESLKKYRVVGVISAGFSCGSATPGLYARVAAYLDFIESVVWPSPS